MHIKNSKGERELLLDNNNSPVEFIDGGLIRNFPIDLFDKFINIKFRIKKMINTIITLLNNNLLFLFIDIKS